MRSVNLMSAAAALAFILAPVASVADPPRAAPTSQAQVQLSYGPVAAKASPAVVYVYAQRVTKAIVPDPRFAQFGIAIGVPREQIEKSLGSGVLVRGDGVIATNHHVIEGADSLKIVLDDRREFDAKLLLDDPSTDLAVLKIDTKGEKLPTLALADTHALQVGDLVLAIGNPYGLQQTVTSGIVSALGRTDVTRNDFSFYIQTDASINRGNSGGALVDMQGKLVGINTAIISSTGDSNGLGFAIPSEMVGRVVDNALSGGKVVRPWLGVKGQPVTQDLAKSLGLSSPQGVLIAEIYPGGAADKGGLQRGDVVLSANGTAVNDDASLKYQAATQKPGSTIALAVVRGGKRITVNAPASPAPRAPADPRVITAVSPLQGTHIVTLSPAQAEDLGVDAFTSGVIIDELDGRGIAARVGFRPGDVIFAVNGQPVKTSAELDKLMKSGARNWRIGVDRGGQKNELAVQL
mgnify:CR=1 FL=1